MSKAPRLPFQALKACARGVLLALCLLPAGKVAFACEGFPPRDLPERSATFVQPNGVSQELAIRYPDLKNTDVVWHVEFFGETNRYAHNIMGRLRDATGLVLWRAYANGMISCPLVYILDADHVFEDLAPRLADITGDGRPEIVTVRSNTTRGAQLVVYDQHLQRLAETPYIGRRNRWLSVIGIADLDQDGSQEIAYIDRPHLAKTLMIWRYKAPGQLVKVAEKEGLTNHRIGWDYLVGGVRDCEGGPEVLVSNGDWTQIQGIRLNKDGLTQQGYDIVPTINGFQHALACEQR